MKRISSLAGLIVGLTAFLVITPLSPVAAHGNNAVELSTTTRPRVEKTYARLPLSFEANHGQADNQVTFLSRGPGYQLFLSSTDAVLVLREREQKTDRGQTRSLSVLRDPKSGTENPKSTVVRMKLVGANSDPKVTGLEQLPGKVNYFIGNNPKKWQTNIPTYKRIEYQEVYPGVNLVYYGNQRQLEYDFVVSPGADPKTIKLAFEGADKVEIDDRGDLILKTASGSLRMHKPLVYQEVAGVRKEVSGNFVLNPKSEIGNLKSEVVGFQVAAYDASRPLVIDPVLSYSTYLGGSGDEFAADIALDSSGNAYVTGRTSSTNFPTANPLQATNAGGPQRGGEDAFVAKLNTSGTALIYSTYLGGSGSDAGSGIAVDNSGNAYVTGSTDSTNFPATLGAFQTTGGGGSDAFVLKLNATGSGLVYSTYLGGPGPFTVNNDGAAAIAVDASGNAYVTGLTFSPNFPTKNAFQATLNGIANAFVTKLNATGTDLVYSTYLGGSGAGAEAIGIAVDASGNAFVTGSAVSSDFPTLNPLQATFGGTNHCCIGDAFIAKFGPTGSLIYSTYLGGSGADGGSGVAVDSLGNVYVSGLTGSANFPTASPFQPAYGGGPFDAFVAKINPSGTALSYSTYLGGSGSDSSEDIAVDASRNAYVTGRTSSTNFPVANPLQPAFGGGSEDAFVAKIDASGTALIYSTYLGGSGTDRGFGIAVDASGSAYVAGFTDSTDFPTSPGAFQTTYGGGPGDAFVAKISTEAPVANAGPDQTVNEGTVVTLDGSASTGQNLSFNWEQVAGPSVTLSGATSASPSFTAPQLAGGFGSQVFTFKLTVSSGGQSSSDTVNVTVVNFNHAPEAEAGGDQTVNEGSVVMLDGSASFDPDGDAVMFQWVQTGGTAVALTGADTAKPTFTAPLIAGGISGLETLTFEVTVSDSALSAIDQVTVFVENVNHTPVADAGTPQTVHPGTVVTLNGSASNDPDGDVITFQWTQVGGPAVVLNNSTTANPNFVAPPVSGTTDLTFRLAVSDTQLTSEADVAITVKNGPPLCNLAQAVPSVLWPPNHGMISVTIAGVTDPDDASVAIAVQSVTQDEPVNGLGDGDTSPDAVIQGSTVLLRAERSGKGNGRVYEVHFTADDGQGGVCTGSVKVGVPHSMKPGMSAVDDGQLYDSTQP